jgi:uncharacterized repeat protein (TIGR01451 family)
MPISDSFRRQYFFRGVLFAQFLWAFAADANGAESTSGLAIETLAERRITAESDVASAGFVAADRLNIGDEIFYTLRVRNATNATLERVVVIKAVPRNTEYVADSAVGPAAIIGYSVDGGTTFAEADQLEVVTLPGVTRRAVPSDYTHIRWQLRHPLAAGATALLRFRSVFK